MESLDGQPLDETGRREDRGDAEPSNEEPDDHRRHEARRQTDRGDRRKPTTDRVRVSMIRSSSTDPKVSETGRSSRSSDDAGPKRLPEAGGQDRVAQIADEERRDDPPQSRAESTVHRQKTAPSLGPDERSGVARMLTAAASQGGSAERTIATAASRSTPRSATTTAAALIAHAERSTRLSRRALREAIWVSSRAFGDVQGLLSEEPPGQGEREVDADQSRRLWQRALRRVRQEPRDRARPCGGRPPRRPRRGCARSARRDGR